MHNIKSLEDAARYVLEYVDDIGPDRPTDHLGIGLYALKRGEVGEFIGNVEFYLKRRSVYSGRWKIKSLLPKMDFWVAYDPDYSSNVEWEQWMRHFIKLLGENSL